MGPELLTESHFSSSLSAILVYGLLLVPGLLVSAFALFVFAAHTIAARRHRGDPSQPPDRRPGSRWLWHRQRMGVWLVGAGLMAGVVAVTQLGIFHPYHLRQAFGTTVSAQIHHGSSFETRSGGGRGGGPTIVTHWRLQATTDEQTPREIDDLVEFEGAQEVEPGDRVSVITVPGPDAYCQYGSRPTAGQAGTLVGGALQFLAFLILLAMARSRGSREETV